MKNILYRLKINSLKANPGKFQFIILEKKNRLKYSLKIGSITSKECNKVELLVKKKTHRKCMSHCPVQASCYKANQKILDIR